MKCTALSCVWLLIPGIDVRTLIFELPAVNNHFVVDLCCIVHCKSSWWIRGLPVLFSIYLYTVEGVLGDERNLVHIAGY